MASINIDPSECAFCEDKDGPHCEFSKMDTMYICDNCTAKDKESQYATEGGMDDSQFAEDDEIMMFCDNCVDEERQSQQFADSQQEIEAAASDFIKNQPLEYQNNIVFCQVGVQVDVQGNQKPVFGYAMELGHEKILINEDDPRHPLYFERRPMPTVPVVVAACHFFNTARGCSEGRACRFLHERRNTWTNPNVQHTYTGRQQMSWTNPGAPRQKCRFFNTPTGCSNGTRCAFEH